MLDGYALPLICEAKPSSFTQWFACLSDIINHPLLKEEEKFLWLWLATQSANDASFSCSYSYEQISSALKKTPRQIHTLLFRLRIMGFLQAKIPIWYGELKPEMELEVYVLQIRLPPKSSVRKKLIDLELPIRDGNVPININLIKKFKKKNGE